jgi:hypothetical protein
VIDDHVSSYCRHDANVFCAGAKKKSGRVLMIVVGYLSSYANMGVFETTIEAATCDTPERQTDVDSGFKVILNLNFDFF